MQVFINTGYQLWCIMWPFKKKPKKDKEQDAKITDSQSILMDAAITTVEMAQFLTSKLKDRLDDAIRQFDTTAAIMSDALIICDADGHIKACNPAAQSIFGYEYNDLMRLTVLDLFNSHSNKIQYAMDLWEILKPESVQETVGLRACKKNQSAFSTEVTLTRLARSDGTIIFLMLIRDVSDIIKLKRESEENARRYRSLFDLTFDSLLIVQNDQIVAVNKQAGRMFGYKSEYLLAKEFSKLVKSDSTDLDDQEVHEGNVIRKDGSTMTLLFSGTEILWNDTNACLITARDALKQFDKKFDNCLDMICFFNKNFDITFANDAFKKHYTLTNVGMDIRVVMSETERNAFLLNVNNLTADRPTRRIQFYVDTEHVQDWIDHAVFDENNEIIEVQHSVRDITDFIKEVMNS